MRLDFLTRIDFYLSNCALCIPCTISVISTTDSSLSTATDARVKNVDMRTRQKKTSQSGSRRKGYVAEHSQIYGQINDIANIRAHDPTHSHSTERSPEFWAKKLHAAKVNLKRSIKKAKDLHVRKLVKKLKSKKTEELNAELKRAKEMDVEGVWTAALEGGDIGELGGTLVANEGVAGQLKLVKEMQNKIEEAEKTVSEGRDVVVGLNDKDEEDKEEEEEGKQARPTTVPATNGLGDPEETRKDGGRREEGTKKNTRDNNAKKPQKQEKKKPKNRMGQRARQRLAEKQYGKEKALHIIENRARDQKRKEQQERKERSEHLDENALPHRHRKKPPVAEDDPATLHPSWQAKKAATKFVIPSTDTVARNRITFD